MKNTGQDLEAESETTKDHTEGKPSSETSCQEETKVKDTLF